MREVTVAGVPGTEYWLRIDRAAQRSSPEICRGPTAGVYSPVQIRECLRGKYLRSRKEPHRKRQNNACSTHKARKRSHNPQWRILTLQSISGRPLRRDCPSGGRNPAKAQDLWFLLTEVKDKPLIQIVSDSIPPN